MYGSSSCDRTARYARWHTDERTNTWHESARVATCSSVRSVARARSRSRSSLRGPGSISATSASTCATRSSRKSSPSPATCSSTSCLSRARSMSSSTNTSSARTPPRSRSPWLSTTTTSVCSLVAAPVAATTQSSWRSPTSCCSAPQAQVRRCWPRRSRACSMSPSRSLTPRLSPRPATSVRMSKTSCSS